MLIRENSDASGTELAGLGVFGVNVHYFALYESLAGLLHSLTAH